MDLDKLRETWQEDKNVNSSVKIDTDILASIHAEKHFNKFQQLKWARALESVIFFIIIISLWKYIVADFTLNAVTISALVLNVFAIIGLAGNIGQIALIAQLDFSEPAKELQRKLYAICSHKLQLTRVVILSVPFYMAYVLIGFDVFWGVDIYQHLSSDMISFYFTSSALLLVLCVWLVSKLSYKNIETSWVKAAISFIIGEQILGVAKFLNDAEIA